MITWRGPTHHLSLIMSQLTGSSNKDSDFHFYMDPKTCSCAAYFPLVYAGHRHVDGEKVSFNLMH